MFGIKSKCLFFILAGYFFAKTGIGWGEEKKSFYVTPAVNYSRTKIDEVFYRKNDSNNKVSLLSWDRNIFLYGANIGCELNNFEAEIGFYSSIFGQNCGKMHDYDWLNENDLSMVTTYSVGDNEACKNYEAFFETDWNIPVVKGFSILPAFQVQYSYDSFKREKNAKGWYGDYQGIYDENGILIKVIKRQEPVAWNDPDALKFPYRRWDETNQRYMKGVIEEIDYKIHSVNIWTGLKLKTDYKKMSFNIRTLVALFTYNFSEDFHYVKNDKNVFHLIQIDYFKNFKIGIDAAYNLTDEISLLTAFDAYSCGMLKGDLYSGWSRTLSQKSGNEFSGYVVKTGLKIKLF